LSEGSEEVAPSGDDLVDVSLVAHIPDDLIPWGIENIMEGQG